MLFRSVSCNSGNDGSALVGAIGGTEPYTYLWSNGSTNALAQNLSAGITYTVTVTDANGCTGTADVTLTQPSPLTATAAVDSDASCEGGNGEATVTPSGGVAPYTYFWSNGDLNPTATDLSPGGYTVTVTDKNGCTVIAAVNIDNLGTITALVDDHTDVSCHDGSDGAISITVSGGTAPYTYEIGRASCRETV